MIPFEVPIITGESAHDRAERCSFWDTISSPLLEGLRAAGYKSAFYGTRRDMCRTPWICVKEDINNPLHEPWPLFWEITRHSGLGVGCANGFDAQLIQFETLRTEGLDYTHGNRGWSTAPCGICFPDKHAIAVSSGSRRNLHAFIMPLNYRVHTQETEKLNGSK